MSYVRSAETVTDIAASPETLFDFLDDQATLGSHMGKPSMMMLGGRMSYSLDDSAGRAVGSRISMRGSVLGLELTVDGQEGLGDAGTAGPRCHRSLQDGVRHPCIRWWLPSTGIHQLRRSGNGGGENYRPNSRAYLCTLVRHADGP